MTEPATEMGFAGMLEPGSVLHGTYRIVERLAVGGMGEVYLASHERLPGRFAVKVPRREFRADAAVLRRFRAEAELAATLRHPHIVQVFDFNVSAAGVPYLVMELVEGAHLRHHLGSEGRFAPERVGRIVGQVASALQLAHEQGIIHCDLKLENVMLTWCAGREDFVKVLDFGIARAGWAEEAAADEMVGGTPQFMAPEQVPGGSGQLDDRADQFALACIAYTLLAGCEPFRGEDPLAVLYQVVHEEPEPLDRRLGSAYQRAGRVLSRAMAKDPDRRFASILELAGTLKRALAEVAAAEREAGGEELRRVA
jgi:serine/threonine-protein kinase